MIRNYDMFFVMLLIKVFCVFLRRTGPTTTTTIHQQPPNSHSMSLTIVFGYVAVTMFLYMFFHYKFLKIFDNCTSFCLSQLPAIFKNGYQDDTDSETMTTGGSAHRGGDVRRPLTVWDIPGPINLPMIGTKWVFLWKYSITQIHKVYAGDQCYYMLFFK